MGDLRAPPAAPRLPVPSAQGPLPATSSKKCSSFCNPLSAHLLLVGVFLYAGAVGPARSLGDTHLLGSPKLAPGKGSHGQVPTGCGCRGFAELSLLGVPGLVLSRVSGSTEHFASSYTHSSLRTQEVPGLLQGTWGCQVTGGQSREQQTQGSIWGWRGWLEA